MTKTEQKDAAMDQLFGGLTNPATTASESPSGQQDTSPAVSGMAPVSPKQKKYAEENERVCTIINYELAYKARKIAEREDLNIREVYEEGLRRIISAYEAKNGTIRVARKKGKKGDTDKLSSL